MTRRHWSWICLLVILSAGAAGAATHVGIVTAVEAGACRIIQEGKESPLDKGSRLFPGDVIVKSAGGKAPDVMWWPYAGWKDAAAPERLEVNFTPPEPARKGGFLQDVKSFMGFVETDYQTVQGVSDQYHETVREDRQSENFDEGKLRESSEVMNDSGLLPSPAAESEGTMAPPSAKSSAMDAGGPDASGFQPQAAPPSAPSTGRPTPPPPGKPSRRRPVPRDFLQPGRDATLLPGIPVEFRPASHSSPVSAVQFVKAGGGTPSRRACQGSLAVKPEDLGLKPGETLEWSFGEGQPAGKIRLVGPDFVQQIQEDMKRIRAEVPDDVIRRLQTAAYLQFLSDTYPNDIRLYWLSVRVLDKIQVPAERADLKRQLDGLQDRAAAHFAADQP